METYNSIEVTKQLVKDGKISQEIAETIFPELKESEDERVRKEIISYIKSSGAVTNSNWIAWLEKQGEHIKFLESIQIGDEVTRNPDGVLVNLSQFKRKAEQGEQNLTNSAKTCKDEQNTVVAIPKFRVGDVIRPKGSTTDYTIESISGGCYCGNLWRLPIGCDDDYELVEQKPAWSEEDEIGFRDAMWAIEQARTIAKDENDMGNLWYAEKWLKSLKDRVQPQPKQEWSEEDEKMFEFWNLYYEHKVGDMPNKDVVENLEKFRDWLKALKERYTWKPSDEQIETLNEVIQEAVKMGGRLSKYNKKLQCLESLYNNLKKTKRKRYAL